MNGNNEQGGPVPDDEKKAGTFRISISDENFEFHTVEIPDQKVTGAQIVQAAGKHPVDEFTVLQHLTNHELESVRPSELIDLATKGVERFFVIAGAESYRFTVDGLSMEWPRTSILGEHVKFLAGASVDMELLLDRADTPDLVIEDDESVQLDDKGVERLRTRKGPKMVTVIYNHDPREIERGIYTTEQLMALFGVQNGYVLDLIQPDGEFKELKPGQKIRVKNGMEFGSHAPCGQSS